MSEWIKCSDHMPENYKWVHVKTYFGREGIATHASRWTSKRNSGFKISSVLGDYVTHWRPINVREGS